MPWNIYVLASSEHPFKLVVWQRLYQCVTDREVQVLRTGAGAAEAEGAQAQPVVFGVFRPCVCDVTVMGVLLLIL